MVASCAVVPRHPGCEPARTEAERECWVGEPTQEEHDATGLHPTAKYRARAEAERAVLDAMAKADIYQDVMGHAVFAVPSEEGDACRSELARRGLK